jgi:integrase/recombinase XerC
MNTAPVSELSPVALEQQSPVENQSAPEAKSLTSEAKAFAPEAKAFAPLVRSFLDYLHLEKHFSDYTVKCYGADLFQFSQFLTGQIGRASLSTVPAASTPEQIDASLLKCEPLTVREFLAYLYGQNYTKSTTARKLATLRSFYKFLIRRGQLSVNPLSTIRTPKQEK